MVPYQMLTVVLNSKPSTLLKSMSNTKGLS